MTRFQTYFPHVDNVYSHRSTQRYKRKPFVSHYWDCRLKGRPPGTPKSDDPNKKKRKRVARQRDLCDVKIKITEYFPGPTPSAPNFSSLDPPSTLDGGGPNHFFGSGQPGPAGETPLSQTHAFGMLASTGSFPSDLSGSTRGRYYTIQRVNGNGGNGKGDGVAGPHKHTLEDSDRVKKNSVQRYLLKDTREKKKTQVSDFAGEGRQHKPMMDQRSYHPPIPLLPCFVTHQWLHVLYHRSSACRALVALFASGLLWISSSLCVYFPGFTSTLLHFIKF